MLKFLNYEVSLAEIPYEISLCINISNCPCKCEGCHSPELWEDKGTILTEEILDKLIESNPGISCVCFMGGDNESSSIIHFSTYIKDNYTNIKIAWYSGRNFIPDGIEALDYLKLGPYIEKRGDLRNPNTNQKLFLVTKPQLIDITSIFWKYTREDVIKNIKPGWKLNPNPKIVAGIIKRCNINDGICPCDNDGEDKKCPCSNYRLKDKCCCNLYVRE